MDGTITVAAWRVQDTGLVTAPGPFRRLPGAVRHHQGRGKIWPDRLSLALVGDDLVVEGVGRWPRSDVTAGLVNPGPPVTFVVHIPGADHLLAAAADATTAMLLEALTPATN